MHRFIYDQTIKLRLLESWLPLAQELNMSHEWDCNATELESLVLAAAPALAQSHTLLEARVILWHYHGKSRERNKSESYASRKKQETEQP